MLKSSHKKLLGLALLLLFLVPLGMTIKKVYRGVHLSEMNRSLIAALKRNETATGLALLSEGADANARDVPPDTRSLWLRLWDQFRRKPLPESNAPTALLVMLGGAADGTLEDENVPLMKGLLDAGANVNVSDEDGRTPLLLAASQGKRETVRLLLAKGVPVNAKSTNGSTALYYAATDTSDPVLVQLLLAHGALVDAKSADLTPLHGAVLNGYGSENTTVVRLLLAHGAQVDTQNAFGDTPLTSALITKKVDCVKLLLARGAPITIKDVTMARVHNSAEVVRWVQAAALRQAEGKN